MLHGTISNDDFQPNTGLQCWNHVVTIQNNVATMLLGCVVLISSLEIVWCNIHLETYKSKHLSANVPAAAEESGLALSAYNPRNSTRKFFGKSVMDKIMTILVRGFIHK